MNLMEPVVLEQRYNLSKVFGAALITLGLSGFLYLGWVYFVWMHTLPKFSSNDLFGNTAAVSVVTSPAPSGSAPVAAGFGDLLLRNRGSKVASTAPTGLPAAPVPTKTDSLAILRDSANLGDGAVLGDQTQSAVSLSVPALGIEDVKVQMDVNGSNERIYDEVLTRAVAHLQGSAHPGNFGNAFFFGHSKLPIFASNDYESIFTDLPKIKAGDVVRVKYDGNEYTYQISQTGVVTPKDVFILNQPTEKKMLTLMTCIPPGFANNRYITVGELIQVVKV